MDKAFLEDCLAQGMSLPEIGELAGRPPGTVGYWVKRHGLVANGSRRFARKGVLPREQLELQLARGETLAGIARTLDVSIARVRRSIARHGLAGTQGSRRSKTIRHAREWGEKTAVLECPKHGRTAYWIGTKSVRCKRCNTDGVSRRRRKVKEILVAESGGGCALCGYDRSPAALHFHHLDPAVKAFSISHAGVTRSIESARDEIKKCVLLCSNCHAEVEVGAVELPVELQRRLAD